jgi:ABC-type transporter Mla subunit MlaD
MEAIIEQILEGVRKALEGELGDVIIANRRELEDIVSSVEDAMDNAQRAMDYASDAQDACSSAMSALNDLL